MVRQEIGISEAAQILRVSEISARKLLDDRKLFQRDHLNRRVALRKDVEALARERAAKRKA